MRRAMAVVGVIAIILGVIWMGQGSGYFPYPASSFMIDQRPWIYYGVMMVVVGAVLFWTSRRIR
jgi:hypothetical protein